MNPHEAIRKLRGIGWSIAGIAAHIGMNRTNLYKVANGAMPRYESAMALIAMARSGRKPQRKRT